jgi:glycosyltransferase involved in cell wall biosynthesis
METEHETIETVERLLMDHRQILSQQMGELDKVTHNLVKGVIGTEQQTIDMVERMLGNHNGNNHEWEAQIKHLQHTLHCQQVDKDTHIHHLNLKVAELESSYSRRITAPIHKSFIAARRISRVSMMLPSIIRRGGGLAATAARAIRVLRQDGVQGVFAQVRWLSGIDQAQVESILPPAPDRHDYAAWVEQFDTLDAQARWQITEHIRTWESQPLISIIMPVFNPPLDLLREAVDSVRYQLYPHWELCIADDASTRQDVREYLEYLQHSDPQINVVFREQNGHISAASNSAIEIASGDYVALMDNDDLIAEHALYWVARAIVENSDVCLIYSDEDKVDIHGRRSGPYFKPDWNEFLFRSQNMISHLGVYRRDLVAEVGGFRLGFEGSQDYDLALRCVELIEPTQIIHIPRVLYHWRAHSGSTAKAGDQKPYAAEAGLRALKEHLQRRSMMAHAELLPMGMYRVRHQLPEIQPLVSLIIPTRNAHGLVQQCIESILRLTTYRNYEIILIDNGSDDEEALSYFAELERDSGVRVVRDERPFNYSALNNLAVTQARGELVGLINNDIEVISPEWLEEMVSLALMPRVGAVGARLWYPDNRLQHGGVITGIGGVAGHSHKYLPKGKYGYFGRVSLTQEFSAVTAACLVVRKAVFEEVEGLDEVNLKIAFNDVDFCLRLREAGYVNVFTPFAELYHHESATRGAEDTVSKQQRFQSEIDYMLSRWPRLKEDYAYNPNLTLEHEDFGLAWPPRT